MIKIGDRFEYLVTLEKRFGFRPAGRKYTKWFCLCDCGVKKEIDNDLLRKGGAKSCGCKKQELSKNNPRNKKHGMYKSKEYRAWREMLAVCNNPNKKRYNNYGGRGIVICDKWAKSFVNFFNDVGSKPSDGYVLGRIDINGNYCPSNVCWIENYKQQRNKTNNVKIAAFGKSLCLADWAKELGVSFNCIQDRIKRGWDLEDVVSKSKIDTYDGKYKDISVQYWKRVKRGAKVRDLEFNLTIEEMWQLFEKQDKKCALSGVELCFVDVYGAGTCKKQTASLDRIDNSKGYTINNIQWVHKEINLLRGKMNLLKFIGWCKLVVGNGK